MVHGPAKLADVISQLSYGIIQFRWRNYLVYQSELQCFLSRDKLTGEKHLQGFLAAHYSTQRDHRRVVTKKSRS